MLDYLIEDDPARGRAIVVYQIVKEEQLPEPLVVVPGRPISPGLLGAVFGSGCAAAIGLGMGAILRGVSCHLLRRFLRPIWAGFEPFPRA